MNHKRCSYKRTGMRYKQWKVGRPHDLNESVRTSGKYKSQTYKSVWSSWLRRGSHTAKVPGSIPGTDTFFVFVFFCFFFSFLFFSLLSCSPPSFPPSLPLPLCVPLCVCNTLYPTMRALCSLVLVVQWSHVAQCEQYNIPQELSWMTRKCISQTTWKVQ